jgi:hypothetical protein
LVEKPGYEKDKEGNILYDDNGKPIQRYRLISSAQRINAVTIRDASLPPVDEVSERFAGFPLVTLLDLYSGYDQCTLAEASRDITAVHTARPYAHNDPANGIHQCGAGIRSHYVQGLTLSEPEGPV